MVLTLQQLRHRFLSNAHISEFIYLLHNLKPVCRFIVPLQWVEQYERTAKDYSLHIQLGANVSLETDPGTGYSNKGSLGKGDHVLVYMSKDENAVRFAQTCEEMGLHDELGDALGYPACCRAFFVKATPTASHDFLPALLAEHDNNSDTVYPYQNNICLRYADFCLLAHFPCSLKCTHSLTLAKQFESCLEATRPQYMKMLHKYLKGTVLVAPGYGVVYLHGAQRKNEMVTFTHISGTSVPAMTTLMSNRQITIVDANTIAGPNDKPIEGYVVRFQ